MSLRTLFDSDARKFLDGLEGHLDVPIETIPGYWNLRHIAVGSFQCSREQKAWIEKCSTE